MYVHLNNVTPEYEFKCYVLNGFKLTGIYIFLAFKGRWLLPNASLEQPTIMDINFNEYSKG